MTVSAIDIRRLHRSYAPAATARLAAWFRMLGPACGVSIGYIDPGNWATDIGAGAFGYRLLWVVVLANAIALVLQVAVSRLTTIAGTDLATLISRRWPRASFPLWMTFQGAAVATDVAEFAGIVLGVQLMFHLSLRLSVVIGLAVVTAILVATDRKSKAFEYALVAAVAAVAVVFAYQIPAAHPAIAAMLRGTFVPSVPNGQALILVVGIIGATVMPHNLFLHSSLIAKADAGRDFAERTRRGSFFNRETIVALNVAAFINGAILVVGATIPGSGGSIGAAFAALAKNGRVIEMSFGAALLVSGIAASMTATVSGDFIFASFSPRRCLPIIRRAVTIVPAAVIIACGVDIDLLLVWSQVALALVLPVALVPLLLLMLEARGPAGERIGRSFLSLAAAAAFACVAFDAVMIVQTIPHP